MSTEIEVREPLSKAAVAIGVYALCEAFAMPLGENTAPVFHQALEPHVTDAEFKAAVKVAIETEERWCAPAVLIRIVREMRADAKLEAEERMRRQTFMERVNAPVERKSLQALVLERAKARGFNL